MKVENHSEVITPETKISDISKQYQKINEITELLKREIDNNCETTNFSELFYSLTHLHTHFFIQEQITLANYKFEMLGDIKFSHSLYLKSIIILQEKIAEKPLEFCTEMLSFFQNWTKNYLLTNQNAIDFLISKGVK